LTLISNFKRIVSTEFLSLFLLNYFYLNWLNLVQVPWNSLKKLTNCLQNVNVLKVLKGWMTWHAWSILITISIWSCMEATNCLQICEMILLLSKWNYNYLLISYLQKVWQFFTLKRVAANNLD